MATAELPSRTQGRSRPSRPPPPSNARPQEIDLKCLQQTHDKAYKDIDRGLGQDEEGCKEQAVQSYQSGLSFLCQALCVNTENMCGSDEEKDKAKQLQQKMTKTKLQIEYRLQALQAEMNLDQNGHLSDQMDNPPSYDEAISMADSSVSEEAFLSLGDSIMSESTDSQPGSLVCNATEMYCIPEGVQIFFITPEGFVSAPSYPSSLRMLKFTDSTDEINLNRPPAFLQVHDWYYPLIPGTSPALRATNGSYIFPDTTSQEEGAAVGLLLPESISPQERQRFEQILASMTHLQEQMPTPSSESATPSAPPQDEQAAARYPHAELRYPHPGIREGQVSDTKHPVEGIREGKEHTKQEEEEEGEKESETTSSKIVKGIAVAADWISWGVGKGAEKAGNLIKTGSEKVREKLHPESQPVTVDPRVQTGARYARKGANVAYKVSSYMIKKLGEASVAVAKEVAPHLSKQGKKLLPKSVTEKSSDGNSKIDDVIDVTLGGLKGFGTVYLSLEAAAKALGTNIANETVKTVDHKYGTQAGQLTENTLHTVGGIALAAYNVDQMGIKAIAKRTAKETGKEFVKDIASSGTNKQ